MPEPLRIYLQKWDAVPASLNPREARSSSKATDLISGIVTGNSAPWRLINDRLIGAMQARSLK
ncbi:MAG: hypothetical protein ACMG55_13570, partial [Microcoleus sp.]